MKKFMKKLVCLALIAVMTFSASITAFAENKPFLSLGQDLSPQQQATVLQLLGVDAAQLPNYNVSYVSNTEEHQYLDALVGAQAVGSKSLSSVVIYEAPAGSGLNITTKNITFCTEGMYRNACATAGIKDATIIVAGPSPISGTAALVGIFKAYQQMTGKTIDTQVINGALNELITTGNLEGALENVDSETIEQLLAYLKQYMKDNNLHDEASIGKAVDEAAKEYGVVLNDSERSQVISLLMTLDKLDLDAGALSTMVSGYQKVNQAASSVGAFFQKIGQSISDFFQGLFGKK